MLAFAKTAVVCLLLALPSATWADWVLDNAQSALHFVSVKQGDKAETHTFQQLSGVITSQGQGKLEIDLASVATNIPIRDTRMRELLFETARFPKATVTVDLAKVGVKPGIQTLPVTLELHGVKQELPSTVAITEVGRTVQVASVAPVVVDAAAFGLADGVGKLREVAGLDSISLAVPVTFFLSFVAQP